MPQRPLRLALLALLGTLTLSACGGTTYFDSSVDGRQPALGSGWTKVKPFEITLPTDEPIDDATDPDLTGPLLVNLWASFCTPCKTELPLLAKLAKDGTLAVAGFTRDRSEDKAREALATAGVTYPNWMDNDARVAVALDGRVPINQIPSSALIRDGKVVAVHIGEFKSTKDVLEGLELK
ncbi:TlpA family protein disulfide reductase [Nocardioides marmoriginsengisoli]|uniref:TlpA family protein disulfide reductase n=1 Tax=Nocardioides marmoriginsengisoli TaxID=661483 RepID=A0A3N0CGI9_9ACTN|nr:TlpA disulfide reductase family protein [Nocardioides marmoriginsengisoli]RNL62123.1 TlpA family protein disulfide reductase [Nocardioides marmoriginsengisoli]